MTTPSLPFVPLEVAEIACYRDEGSTDRRVTDLRRVQRRRELPTRLTQAFQVRVLRGLYPGGSTGKQKSPLIIKVFRHLPALRRLAAYFIGIGIRSEHVRG